MLPVSVSRPVLYGAAAALVAGLLAGLPTTTQAAASTTDRQIHHRSWSTPKQLQSGRHRGTAVQDARLVMTSPAARRRAGGTTFDVSRWTSPWVSPGFALTELLPSWNATTPGKSRIKVLVRARTNGTRGSWDTLAVWARGDKHLKRRTLSGQPDDLGSVNVDTWRTNSSAGVKEWQLRVVLQKPSKARKSPAVSRIGATASALPSVSSVPTSAPGPGRGITLNVPSYSQMIHRGHSPQYGSGGQAWCSPTSTSMVLGYYGRLPKPKQYAWVGAGHADPWVDHAARMTYDHAYRGAGNWPFNTAYAGNQLGATGTAFVTRLRNLREAEDFIAAGIPLVVSISFGSGQLTGAPISATAGHLLVIVGFTASGDVVVNDPAASTNTGVRRTYKRGQFENAWLPKSGGLTYVIADKAHPLPARAGRGNW
ncbi:C39 family peptidase [Nocardioides sp.]|uniref:C39 family peptidase n=1 Tax=Nocardioides sp. TaxID=35761 RepID=UPI00273648A7|nr:C39 family peptidase [Nocardioides sp.]MDP3893179.1 C39 family peptidase [Nocardioides sp.]